MSSPWPSQTRLLVGLAVGLVACAPASRLEEATAPVAPVLRVDSPAPPATPASPEFTCPSGWQRAASGVFCEPWPRSAQPQNCPAGEARFPGTPGCARVGAGCAADGWPAGLPTTRVLYVGAQATAPGNGTRTAPFKTIAAATSAARAGDTIALSQGTFNEDVRIPAGVLVKGACALQTRIVGAGGVAVVRAGGLEAALQSVTVTGPSVGVLVNPSGNSLALESVIIDGAEGVGLLVGNTARVSGRDVVIRNTQPNAAGQGGRGISCELGGVLALERVVLQNNQEHGLNVNGSRVSLTDAVISDTRPRADGLMGRGVSLNQNAEVTLTRVVIERVREAAVLLANESRATFTDVLVRDTIDDDDGGLGLVADGRSVATLRRVAFVKTRATAVQIRGASTLDAEDLLIDDVAVAASTGRDGIGLDVVQGSTLRVVRALVARAHTGAIGVRASTATLSDVSVQGLLEARGLRGVAAAVQLRSSAVTVARLEVQDFTGVGLLVEGAGAAVECDDVTIRDGRPFQSGDEGGGGGLSIQGGARLTANRLALNWLRQVGVAVLDSSSTAALTDLQLADVESDGPTGEQGRGVHVQLGRLTLTRASIARVTDVGLFTSGAVEATHLTIEDVVKRACSRSGVCDDLGGSALAALESTGRFTGSMFTLTTSAQCGVLIATGASASLSRGLVRGHPIGVCLQVPGFDVQRLTDKVDFVENGARLDASDLPLPTLTVKPYGTR